MFLSILGFLVFVASILVAIASHDSSSRRRGDANPTPLIVGVGLAIALVLIALSTFSSVPARNVGVVTSLGRPTGQAFQPGFHLKAPWHKVNDIDGTVQLIDNIGVTPGDKDHPDVKGRTTVRLAKTNSLMYVDNVVRWQIVDSAAPELYQSWSKKGVDNVVADRVGPGLVQQQVTTALNAELSTYDPYSTSKPSNDALSAGVTTRLNQAFGSQVKVVSFSVQRVDFDDATQARINSIQEEVARTTQAKQARQTATQTAAANKALAASVSKSPNVLVSRCLDIQAESVEKGQSLTGAPSCFGGGSSTILQPSR